jgi:hypothetical protein
LAVLKKYYPTENAWMKRWIEVFSQAARANYPEINQELPK